MYAYVRFSDDRSYYISNVKDIKNFNPTNTDDFNKQKIYQVSWEDGLLYDAQMIFLCSKWNFSDI